MAGTIDKLTAEQLEWFKGHFRNTRNEEIGDRIGVSVRTVCRLARQLGLEKSRAFMKHTQAEAAAAARYFNIKRGAYPPKGYIVPGSEKYRFKPGEHRLTKAQDRRRIRKVHETRTATIERERARIKAGLKPLTRLKLRLTDTKKDGAIRYYLRQRGYKCQEDMYTMVYDSSTKRSQKHERNPGPFRFVEA